MKVGMGVLAHQPGIMHGSYSGWLPGLWAGRPCHVKRQVGWVSRPHHQGLESRALLVCHRPINKKRRIGELETTLHDDSGENRGFQLSVAFRHLVTGIGVAPMGAGL